MGRADIDGSKNNVAVNAWLPQTSYPCGICLTLLAEHFSDLKDGYVMSSQFVFVPNIKLKRACFIELALPHLR